MDSVLAGFVTAADKAIDHLKQDFSKMQTGVANAGLLDGVLVEAYGSMQPLRNVATISVPEPRVITIQAWDKSVLRAIETAIQKAELRINPVNNGEAIILNIPPLTEERRRDLAKDAKKIGEETRVVIRQARQDAHNKFKQMEKADEITEDDRRMMEKRLQDKVDVANKHVDELIAEKEKQIMTV